MTRITEPMIFFQEADDIALIGNWSQRTKLVVIKSKFHNAVIEFLMQNDLLQEETDY